MKEAGRLVDKLLRDYDPQRPSGRSERSVVLAEQQCGHSNLHLPSSKGLLYLNGPSAGKRARDLMEPA